MSEPVDVSPEALAIAPGNRLRVYVLVAAAVQAVLLAGGGQMVKTIYTDTDGHLFDARGAAGVMLWMAGAVMGPWAVALLLVGTAKARHRCGLPTALVCAGLTTLACAVFAAWSMAELVQPQNTFFTPMPDTLWQFLGGLAFAAYVPATLLGLCVVGSLLAAGRTIARAKEEALGAKKAASGASSSSSSSSSSKPHINQQHPGAVDPHSPRRHQPDSFAAHALKPVAALVFLLCAVFFSTTLFTAMWNYSSQSYFTATSTFSMLPQSVQWTWPAPSDADAAAGWIQAVVIPKVYIDVVVYFSLILAWVAAGLAASFYAPCRRACHRRVLVKQCARVPHAFALFPHGASVGELFTTSSFAALAGWWFYFWSTSYTRISDEAQLEGDTNAGLQVYARVMGHMTTLGMSFLTLPVARNSVWESAFGIPFDRAVAYHRALGRYVWAAVTSHALVWWVKWAREGTLLSNIVTLDNLQTSNPPVCFNGNCVHSDNFTIPLVEFAWLALTASLLVAHFMRRHNYELFQYTHVFALFFTVSALVHAWSHWYYTAGGLILFAFDKVARTAKAARSIRVVSLSSAGGITRLVVDARGATGAGGHYAGQYAWLNIPALSILQWHPFTISSSPSAALRDGTVEFHIKDMGEGTWTGDLAKLAAQWASEERIQRGVKADPRDLCVGIDGPYGRAGRYYDAPVLVLVAGGIGFTPMRSILQDLLLRAEAAAEAGLPLWAEEEDGGAGGSDAGLAPLGRLRRVHLVWTIRDAQLAETFAPLLARLRDAGAAAAGAADGGGASKKKAASSSSSSSASSAALAGVFTLHLHITSGGAAASSAAGQREKGKAGKKGKKGSALSIQKVGVDDDDDEDGIASHDVALLGGGGHHHHHHSSPPATEGGPSPVEAGWVGEGLAAESRAAFKEGRPDLSSIFARAAAEAKAFGGSRGAGVAGLAASAFVCGPEGMVDAASALADEHGMDFHSEVFHF